MTDPLRDEPVFDKRFLLAIGLSVLILLVWQYYFAPPPPAPPAPQAQAQPLATPPEAPAVASARGPEVAAAAAAAPAPTATPPVAAASVEQLTVTTDLFEVALTNEGGRALSWKIREFRNGSSLGADLVPAASRKVGRLPLALDVDDAGLTKRLNEALYEVKRTEADGGARTVTFTWSDGAGLSARKALTFREGSPLVDVAVAVEDRGRPVAARIVWGPGLEADDASTGGYIHYTGQFVASFPGAQPTRTARTKVDVPMAIPAAAGVRWAGLEEQYFAAIIIPTGGSGDVVVRSEPILPMAKDASDNPKPQPELTVAVGLPSGEARIFVGPKRFTSLRALGLGLEEVVWFSDYGLISFLASWLFQGLLWIHDHVAANYGVAIILATLALRIVLFPVNQYSMVRMRRTATQMQKVQPKLKAIQAKWKKSKDKDARTKMNEETMELYKREGVNPFGGVTGCLPMLAQFPILIAFYNVLTAAVELRGAPFFGWIVDMTQKDPYYITPLLMGATMFIQQKMTPATGADPAQQRVMLIMPVVFTVMFLNLPAGLVLYWLVNNVLGIGQQWLVNRHIERTDAAVADKA